MDGSSHCRRSPRLASASIASNNGSLHGVRSGRTQQEHDTASDFTGFLPPLSPMPNCASRFPRKAIPPRRSHRLASASIASNDGLLHGVRSGSTQELDTASDFTSFLPSLSPRTPNCASRFPTKSIPRRRSPRLASLSASIPENTTMPPPCSPQLADRSFCSTTN